MNYLKDFFDQRHKYTQSFKICEFVFIKDKIFVFSNEKKIDALVNNYMLYVLINNNDDFLLIRIYYIIKHKFIMKGFIHLYNDSRINVKVFDRIQCLYNVIV